MCMETCVTCKISSIYKYVHIKVNIKISHDMRKLYTKIAFVFISVTIIKKKSKTYYQIINYTRINIQS